MLEDIYIQSNQVSSIWIYGDILNEGIVAIVS